jgi:hypothetical protein
MINLSHPLRVRPEVASGLASFLNQGFVFPIRGSIPSAVQSGV